MIHNMIHLKISLLHIWSNTELIHPNALAGPGQMLSGALRPPPLLSMGPWHPEQVSGVRSRTDALDPETSARQE